MISEQYDSFIDPGRWPDAEEIRRVAAVYGWRVRDAEGAMWPVEREKESRLPWPRN